MSASAYHPADRNAAFTGLIVGLVALAILVFGIVKLTNAKFGAHEKPAAQAAK